MDQTSSQGASTEKPQQATPPKASLSPMGKGVSLISAGKLNLPTPGKQRILAGWMSPDHLAMFPNGCQTPADMGNLNASYAAARTNVAKLPIRQQVPTPPAPFSGGKETAWVSALQKTPDFNMHYGHIPTRIGLVPIDELVLFQPFLAPHVEKVPPTEIEILEWCLPHEFVYQYQTRLDGGRIFILPSSPNVMFAGPQLDPRGVLLALAGNANWVQVLRVAGNFYMIKNGIHRVTSLAASGYTHVPAIVSDVSSLEEAIPVTGPGTNRPWFTPAEFSSFKRPPRVVDFFDRNTTLELPHENLKRVIEIRLDVQMYQLP